jgi:hypothetical protein
MEKEAYCNEYGDDDDDEREHNDGLHTPMLNFGFGSSFC